MNTEERKLEEERLKTGLERFYKRFNHAQSLGYEWDYCPPQNYKIEELNQMRYDEEEVRE